MTYLLADQNMASDGNNDYTDSQRI